MNYLTAEEAAALINPGDVVAISGFTGAGHPKAVPAALAERIVSYQLRGEPFQIDLYTGASTSPEIDGGLALLGGIRKRLPYQSDSCARDAINGGSINYLDMHLSHVAACGYLPQPDVAIVEISGVLGNGWLIPSSSIGNNVTWLETADKIILELNDWQPDLNGMHDVYSVGLPPNRKPIPLARADDLIGLPYYKCDWSKVVGVVKTNKPDRLTTFASPDQVSRRIAEHVLEFLTHEVGRGRLPRSLLPLQSGVGNVANAVFEGLLDSSFSGLQAYSEVIQDGMLNLLLSGKLKTASATAYSLSSEGLQLLLANLRDLRRRIILRPADISNNPEVIRRLGCLSMNGLVEAGIYGEVNSSIVMGSKLQNGIGGSGDFARNAQRSIFTTPSTAKGGKISCIVPMASHVDHIPNDVHVIVTEYGFADLRGLSPRQRAVQMIRIAHPDYRPLLEDYLQRANRQGGHMPHLLAEAFSFHQRYLETGTMLL